MYIIITEYLKTNSLHAHAETMFDRLCYQNAAAEKLVEFQKSTSSLCQEGSEDFLLSDMNKNPVLHFKAKQQLLQEQII